MSNFESAIKNILEHYAPMAYELDQDPILLKQAYENLIKQGALGLLIPESFGGLGGGRADWARYNIEMAACSGALLFLQAQHQFSVHRLKALLPESLRVHDVLQEVINTKQGLGFISLLQAKSLTITRDNSGWILNGKIRWITGWDFFERCYLSFESEGLQHHALIPFRNRAGLTYSTVMNTSMFQSANTVSLNLENYFLPDEAVLYSNQIRESVPMEHPTTYNFAGIAKACLREAKLGKYCRSEKARLEYFRLEKKLEAYCETLFSGVSKDPLAMRARGLKLAENCASFARLMCGASSVLENHPMGRISKELWQNAVAGISEAQVEAYLE